MMGRPPPDEVAEPKLDAKPELREHMRAKPWVKAVVRLGLWTGGSDYVLTG